jgi:energy-coupling factor transporter ATP-binding protein EcfA2
MQLYTISGLTIYIINPQLIPPLFKDSLDHFKAEKPKEERADIVLHVEYGRPEECVAVLSSGVLTVCAANKDTTVFRFTRKPKCALRCSHDSGQATLYLYDDKELSCPELSEQVRVLFRMMFEQTVASRGILSLHASAFVWKGEAICVTGPSGSGKSTLTKNWMKAVPASYILNGDRPVICLTNEPPLVCGAPWSGAENIFINERAPLRAIIEVKQHCVNKIQKLDPRRAYHLILKRISKPQWNTEATVQVIGTMERLISKIPVYRFYCEDNPSAGKFLHRALADANKISSIPEGEKDMKIKEGFVTRKVLDDYMAVPVGSGSAAAAGAIMLNDVGFYLWEKLAQPTTEEALLECLLSEYDINDAVAAEDLSAFLQTLRKAGALEEDE